MVTKERARALIISIRLFCKASLLFAPVVFSLIFTRCQHSKTEKSGSLDECNRAFYGTVKYIEHLPQYICIPNGFIVDDYVRISDTNGDGKDDFLALKFNKREDDQVDGDSTYWQFYSRSTVDTTFILRNTLTNLVPPFIEDIDYDYLLSHPLAANIFEDYPRRVSHELSFQLQADTIRLSYKFEDTYGKSFLFIYRNDTWYLENIEYFIGELPMYWWRDGEFYYALNDKLKVIETRKPKVRIAITEFDLKEAFKYREDESAHLADWHVDTLDESMWKSIEEVKFQKCQGMDLPEDWNY